MNLYGIGLDVIIQIIPLAFLSKSSTNSLRPPFTRLYLPHFLTPLAPREKWRTVGRGGGAVMRNKKLFLSGRYLHPAWSFWIVLKRLLAVKWTWWNYTAPPRLRYPLLFRLVLDPTSRWGSTIMLMVEKKDFGFLVEFPRQLYFFIFKFDPHISFTIEWFVNLRDVACLHVLSLT